MSCSMRPLPHFLYLRDTMRDREAGPSARFRPVRALNERTRRRKPRRSARRTRIMHGDASRRSARREALPVRRDHASRSIAYGVKGPAGPTRPSRVPGRSADSGGESTWPGPIAALGEHGVLRNRLALQGGGECSRRRCGGPGKRTARFLGTTRQTRCGSRGTRRVGSCGRVDASRASSTSPRSGNTIPRCSRTSVVLAGAVGSLMMPTNSTGRASRSTPGERGFTRRSDGERPRRTRGPPLCCAGRRADLRPSVFRRQSPPRAGTTLPQPRFGSVARQLLGRARRKRISLLPMNTAPVG